MVLAFADKDLCVDCVKLLKLRLAVENRLIECMAKYSIHHDVFQIFYFFPQLTTIPSSFSDSSKATQTWQAIHPLILQLNPLLLILIAIAKYAFILTPSLTPSTFPAHWISLCLVPPNYIFHLHDSRSIVSESLFFHYALLRLFCLLLLEPLFSFRRVYQIRLIKETICKYALRDHNP